MTLGTGAGRAWTGRRPAGAPAGRPGRYWRCGAPVVAEVPPDLGLAGGIEIGIAQVPVDADGLYVVTWGEVKSMSWQFYDVYADEAYAVISQDFIDKSGIDPAGFDLKTLESDLRQLRPGPSARCPRRRPRWPPR
jgi:hypothetical protein